MAVSYNGWTASPDPNAIGITTYTIPGTGRKVALRATAAPVLLWAAAYWDRYIEDIEAGTLDDWGYAYRQVRGGEALSNHSSGTALDINAARYPLGTRRMSLVKKAKVRALVARVNTAAGMRLLVWGGEWSRPDEMHLELASGTDAVDVYRTMRRLTVRETIKADAVITAFRSGSRIAAVSMTRVQERLVASGHLKGRYAKGLPGRKTREAMKAWQKSKGYRPTGIPEPRQLTRLAGDVYRVV